MAEKILVVDDTPLNVKLLADVLTARGYSLSTAASGSEALDKIREDPPDLVLLDVMMPQMTGFEVCRTLRAAPETALLPVVMVTALDAKEDRILGLEAGADDFLSKPINQSELLARVRSLLRIRALHRQVAEQQAQLESWNRTLEERVAQGLAQLERLSFMKRFFSPAVANLILTGSLDPLKSHRSEITVVSLDLRGFTAFTESADPEEVMNVLREYQGAMGKLIASHDGTVEHFAGDGIMIFFNDPIPLENPAHHAVRMAMGMHAEFENCARGWRKQGHDLKLGIGIAQGYATMGTIGFEGRLDYGAVGGVCILAARLCSEAKGGQTLVAQKVLGKVEDFVESIPIGELTLKGIPRPVPAFNIKRLLEGNFRP